MSADPLDVAIGAALDAGDELMRRWRLPDSGRTFKSSATDEVSDADRAAEALIIDRLRSAFPRDEIVSEEAGGSVGTSGRRWLVDPLDGTINWLYRIPRWSVTIACADDRYTLAGVVYDPVLRELYHARRDQGAWLSLVGSGRELGEPRRLAVTTITDLSLALLADGFSYDAEERREQARREVSILPRVRDVRRMGSAALDLANVAAARVDCYGESGGHEWDWAAGSLLVTEAGGKVSEGPGVRADAPTLIASGPGIHDALVALIRSVQMP